MGFFDGSSFIFDEKDLNRMNERYVRIIHNNVHCIQDKSILDLGSFNGRWSWAALKTGASFVLGIEGRAFVMEPKLEEFKIFQENSYDFMFTDIFEGLKDLTEKRSCKFDTIFCLGIYYHVMDHFMLFKLMDQLNPKTIIFDTGLVDTDELKISVHKESTDSPLNALPGHKGNDQAIVGIVSRGLLHEFADFFQYDLRYMNWNKEDIENLENLDDYFVRGEDKKGRFTVVLTKRSE